MFYSQFVCGRFFLPMDANGLRLCEVAIFTTNVDAENQT